MVVAIETRKIAYFPVPKAGCSSVKAALARIEDGVAPSEADHAALHQRFPTRRFRLARFRDYDGWWRFTVVRDPIRRLMSVYTDRVVKRKDLHSSRRMRHQDVLPMDPDPDFFFLNLDAYRRTASVIQHHTMPASRFIGRYPSRFDKVFRTDDLQLLAKELSARSDEDIQIPRMNRSNVRLEFSDLNAATRDALRPGLAGEYALLERFFPSPFT